MPSQLSHGKFCEGAGAGGMQVAGPCPRCCAPPTADTDTSETEASSEGESAADGEGGGDGDGYGDKDGDGKKKERTVPGPGSYLDDIPGFEIGEVEKWRFCAWGLGRGVGMGAGREEGRRPRRLRKERKVVGVKRGKVRMVLEEEGEEV